MNGRTATVFVVMLSVLILVVTSLKTGFNVLDPANFQLESKLIYIIVSSLAIGSLLMFLLAAIFGVARGQSHSIAAKDSPASNIRQAETALLLGQWDRVLELLDEEMNGEESARAHKLRGDLEVNRKDFEKAEHFYQKSIPLSNGPERAASLFSLANLRSLEGKFEEAADLYREVLKIVPTAAEVIVRLRDQEIRDQNWKEALSFQEDLEKQVPKILETPEERMIQAGIRYEVARTELELGSVKTTQSMLKYVFRLTSNFVPAHLLAGEIQEKLGNSSAALKVWEQGLRVTQHPAMLLRIGEHFLSQNLPDQAIEFFRSYAASQPDDFVPEYCLGHLFLKLEMIDEATRVFEKIRRLHPEWLLNQIILGDLYQRVHKPEEAVRQFRMLLDISESQSTLPWQCYECSTTYPEYRSFCLECLEWNVIDLNRNQAGMDFGHEKSTAYHL